MLAKEGDYFPRLCSHWKVWTPRLELALLAVLCHTALYELLTQNPTHHVAIPQSIMAAGCGKNIFMKRKGNQESIVKVKDQPVENTNTDCRFHCLQNPAPEALSFFRPQGTLQEHPTGHFSWSALRRGYLPFLLWWPLYAPIHQSEVMV